MLFLPASRHSDYSQASSQIEIDLIYGLSNIAHKSPGSEKIMIRMSKNGLSDYTTDEKCILSSLGAFVNKTSLQLKCFEIKEVTEPESLGDKVYSVMDSQTKRSLTILKVYKDISENFFPEVFSLKYLKEANLKDFSFPEIKALGRCRYKGSQYFLMHESVAPGFSLLQHFKNSDFDTIRRGITACGRSLAKLHSQTLGPEQPFPEKSEVRTREYLKEALKKLREYPVPEIDSNKLLNTFENILTAIKSEKQPSAVIHGNTKLVNVFFDSETEKATWIDPSKLSESITPSGEPIGIPAKDFYSFFADIEDRQMLFSLNKERKVSSKALFSDEDIQLLKEVFIAGYTEAGGIPPTKEQFDFFCLAADVDAIAGDKTRDGNCIIPEPMRSLKIHRMEKIYHRLKSLLQTELQDF